jgi:hypothetical protein
MQWDNICSARCGNQCETTMATKHTVELQTRWDVFGWVATTVATTPEIKSVHCAGPRRAVHDLALKLGIPKKHFVQVLTPGLRYQLVWETVV